MPKVVVDPITRIEGHLRIEAEVSGGKVKEAWSSGTMFRGLEMILNGKDPREAWIWAQRICGVCTTVHALASVRAVENALQIEVPPNAELVRGLIGGSQLVHDHVVHFYQLHALDWVDVTGAAKANPRKASQIAQSISDWPLSSTDYFKTVQDRVKKLVASGQLSLLASGYWGHPAYRLSPELDLIGVAHYLEALNWQRDVIRMHAVLGGKNPHPQTYLVGGMATPLDLTSPQAINPDRINFLRERIKTMRTFVDQVYIPDLFAIAGEYRDWFAIGGGATNYLSYGGHPLGSVSEEDQFVFPRGRIMDRDLTKVLDVDHRRITEYVTRSWYEYDGGEGSGKHPWDGETKPNYTGPKPPYKFLETDQKYSWLKAPRYEDQVMEVGPLARTLIGYGKGKADYQKAVNGALKQLNAPPTALFSTLGRTAARGLETKIVVDGLDDMLNQLERNMGAGDTRNADSSMWDPDNWPSEAQGYGWHEPPRGALGHWVEIKDKTISNYQAVVPSTWNAGPRDAKGQPGPYEQSLVDTPIADPTRPLEILRTVHSFDPCLACAVHVLDESGGEGVTVQVQPH